MAIKWGNTYVTAVKWGNTNCTVVKWGSTVVFPAGGLGYYYGQINSSIIKEIYPWATGTSLQSDHLLFTAAVANNTSWIRFFNIEMIDSNHKVGPTGFYKYIRINYSITGFSVFKCVVASMFGSSPSSNSHYMEISNNVKTKIQYTDGVTHDSSMCYIGAINSSNIKGATLKIYEIDFSTS